MPEIEIKQWLFEHSIYSYEIRELPNNEFIVDVTQPFVNLQNKGLRQFQFSIITGNFHCCSNELTSLKGAPMEVSDNFWCHTSKIWWLYVMQ